MLLNIRFSLYLIKGLELERTSGYSHNHTESAMNFELLWRRPIRTPSVNWELAGIIKDILFLIRFPDIKTCRRPGRRCDAHMGVYR